MVFMLLSLNKEQNILPGEINLEVDLMFGKEFLFFLGKQQGDHSESPPDFISHILA